MSLDIHHGDVAILPSLRQPASLHLVAFGFKALNDRVFKSSPNLRFPIEMAGKEYDVFPTPGIFSLLWTKYLCSLQIHMSKP